VWLKTAKVCLLIRKVNDAGSPRVAISFPCVACHGSWAKYEKGHSGTWNPIWLDFAQSRPYLQVPFHFFCIMTRAKHFDWPNSRGNDARMSAIWKVRHSVGYFKEISNMLLEGVWLQALVSVSTVQQASEFWSSCCVKAMTSIATGALQTCCSCRTVDEYSKVNASVVLSSRLPFIALLKQLHGLKFIWKKCFLDFCSKISPRYVLYKVRNTFPNSSWINPRFVRIDSNFN